MSGWLLEEGEAASRAQEVGSLNDQGIHLLAVVRMLLPEYPVQVVESHGARYFGCHYESETYSFIRAKVGASVVCLVAAKRFPFAGKGFFIEGPVASLLIDVDANTATLVRNGAQGAKEQRVLYEPDETTESAYEEILRRFSVGDRFVGMNSEAAIYLLEVLEEARARFARPLPGYVDCPTSWKAIEHHIRVA